MHGHENIPPIDNPLIATFIKKFGGEFFMAMPGDLICYGDASGDNAYDTPDTETEFYDMVSQSIKQNKNLFLNNRIDFELPPLAVY